MSEPLSAETRAHHPYSPSSLQCYEASPCFLPENEDSEASIAGTKQHHAAETGDLSGLTDEQAEAVEKVWKYRDAEIAERYGEGQYIVVKETYVSVDDEVVFPGWVGTTGGFPDEVVVSKSHTRADIFDWKFGKWDVEPTENNLQGMSYSLGWFNRMPTLEEITVHFALPYLNYADKHTFKRAQFATMLARVKAAVYRTVEWRRAFAVKEVVSFFPTSGSCAFCARIGDCKVMHNFFGGVAKKFSPLEFPSEVNAHLIEDPKQANLAIRAADLAKSWGESVRQMVTARVIEGAPEPEGYSLVHSTTTVVADDTKVEDVAKNFLTDDELKPCREYALTKIDKAISAKTKRGQKQETVDLFRAGLKEAGALKEGKPKIYLQMDRPSPHED